MTLDQYIQASVSLLLDIRNNTRLEGTEALSLVDLFPASKLASEVSTPPKETRQRKAAVTVTTPAGSTATDTSAPADAQQASPSTGAASDDMFSGEPAKPTETPKKEEAAKKVKPPTQDDVRAALVAAQTALKSKDKAVDILAKHTTGGERVLSKLPEANFAALIKECNEAAAKAPK